ncbi:MAG: MerR family transcriptional regulator [Chromatiales bacterium]
MSGITGLNPFTLRTCQRRYGPTEPQRIPRGHRPRTEDDIERVRAILRLVDQGVAIRRVKSLVGQPGGQATAAIPPDAS